MGIVSPFGAGVEETLHAVRKAARAVKPLRLFPAPQISLPVGEVESLPLTDGMPRSHGLALAAALEAMQPCGEPADAVIIGTTTGGMTRTEALLQAGETNPDAYRLHGTASIAEMVARRFGCRGPVLTISTACSSGSVALKLAGDLIRSGRARRVLAGGVDALCRLTYYGFHSLQLVDPSGARPFDRTRRGMTVGEGAAMLVLTAADRTPPDALAELCGGGLSCDAYHSAAPHPEGDGARRAMAAALDDAWLQADAIDYIHLHGTGTADNDLAEARALQALYGNRAVPPVSSLKGAYGHALAAAGAMGAVVSILCIRNGLIPASVGFHEADPRIDMVPNATPRAARVTRVLCNAFGFGGNNAALVFGEGADDPVAAVPAPESPGPALPGFFVHGRSCLTGAGDMDETLARLSRGESAAGTVSDGAILKPLSEKAVRRLKRLSRLVLSLGASACSGGDGTKSPGAVYFGTGWGGLSETHDFLKKLFDTGERFAGPTDFIGSVHNAPAGQAAIHFLATGANITTTGGDASFEQALFCAGLDRRAETLLLVGADEHHESLSPLFDPSATADGGGALHLSRSAPGASCRIIPAFLAFTGQDASSVPDMVACLGGAARIRDKYGLILAGIPSTLRGAGDAQLADFLAAVEWVRPVVPYRRYLGEFATVSAVAAVLAVRFVEEGSMPDAFCGKHAPFLEGRGVLVLGFGHYATALEVIPC